MIMVTLVAGAAGACGHRPAMPQRAPTPDGRMRREVGAATSEPAARDSADDAQRAAILHAAEQGMCDAPLNPANYRRAAFELADDSHDRFWPALYGEAAVLLEPASERAIELRHLLFQNYRDATAPDAAWKTAVGKVAFYRDTGGLVFNKFWGGESGDEYSDVASDVLKVATLAAPAPSDVLDRLAAVRAQFARTLRVSAIEVNGVPLPPNAVWSYHEQLIAAGHFDAYNHWLFGPGAPESFDRWRRRHARDLDALEGWLAQHPLVIDREHPVSHLLLVVPPAGPG